MVTIFRMSVIFMVCLVAYGCPLSQLMSDRLIYKFQGTVSNAFDRSRVSSVRVVAFCEKTRLEPPLETMSDVNGNFALSGKFWGALDDCHLSFEHAQFMRKVIRLKPARELKVDTGAMRIWTIDAELEAAKK